ncbi:MAG: general secretion pathway protein I [Pseudomonadales bacterium]|jgi:general secretion pathway protein I
MMHQPENNCGFTLLEVMVALVIFALLSLAILGLNQHQLMRSIMLDEKTSAMRIAQQHMANALLQYPDVPPLNSTDAVDSSGRSFLIETRLIKLPDSDTSQVTIRVKNSSIDSEYELAVLTSFTADNSPRDIR